MTSDRNGGRRGQARGLALASAAVGTVLVVAGLASQEPDAPRLTGPVGTVGSPEPDRPGASGSGPVRVTGPRETPLGPSRPVSISIPAIGVRSDVFAIGRSDDGTLAVPQPGPNLDKAAWFENSPTPGQPGPAVIEGHVATDEAGPSIFFDLAELRPGDRVEVLRADGRTAVFEVEGLREFPKERFPTELVYGGDISSPTLRLITCSNFDPSVGSHTGNLVVFSRLTRVVGA